MKDGLPYLGHTPAKCKCGFEGPCAVYQNGPNRAVACERCGKYIANLKRSVIVSDPNGAHSGGLLLNQADEIALRFASVWLGTGEWEKGQPTDADIDRALELGYRVAARIQLRMQGAA